MRRNQIGGTDGLVSHAEPGARLRRFSVPAGLHAAVRGAIQMRECGPISTNSEADATSNARMRQRALLGTTARRDSNRSQLVCKFQPSMGSVSFPTAWPNKKSISARRLKS